MNTERRKLKMDELGRLDAEGFRIAPKNPMVVVLDGIRSKNNVGAVFRSSDAFRVEKLYLCGFTPTPPDRDIAKTSLGAESSVEWEHAAEILPLIQKLASEGYKIVSVEQTIGSVMLPDFRPGPHEKYAIVLGNEVGGVEQSVIDLSDWVVEIPQYGTKHSLNISVAAGIVLYAFSTHFKP